MATTIQIKRGTGSAVPSGLLDGELAINLDDGTLYFGLYAYNSSSTNLGVYNNGGASGTTNPYFSYNFWMWFHFDEDDSPSTLF